MKVTAPASPLCGGGADQQQPDRRQLWWANCCGRASWESGADTQGLVKEAGYACYKPNIFMHLRFLRKIGGINAHCSFSLYTIKIK